MWHTLRSSFGVDCLKLTWWDHFVSTLQQVNALEPKRTLYILNKFVIHTVDFLNKFSTAAEDVSDYLSVVK